MPTQQLPPLVGHMPSTRDVSWFIDMFKAGQLNLNPPYQRHSVWGLKDKRFFLDTIFRGFLCPPIYIHKTVDGGRSMYAVVDGKQRIESVLFFYQNKLAMPADFGDDRLNGKRWKDVKDDPELVERFLNFSFPVEMINNISSVKEIFDRLNRNSKILNPQELRHARHSGWFISFAEKEVESNIWTICRVWTKGNAKRMRDVQTISELMILAIDGDVSGFNQDRIDAAYAFYDSMQDFEQDNNWNLPQIDEVEFQDLFSRLVGKLEGIVVGDEAIEGFVKDTKHLYSLWGYLVKKEFDASLPDFSIDKYKELINYCLVARMGSTLPEVDPKDASKYRYFINGQGASTELPQRRARQEALVEIMS